MDDDSKQRRLNYINGEIDQYEKQVSKIDNEIIVSKEQIEVQKNNILWRERTKLFLLETIDHLKKLL